jgi:hypothetical protein
MVCISKHHLKRALSIEVSKFEKPFTDTVLSSHLRLGIVNVATFPTPDNEGHSCLSGPRDPPIMSIYIVNEQCYR